MKLISVLAHNRLDYIAQMLHALAHADGIGGYRVMFFVEPGNPATLELIDRSRIPHRTVTELPPHHVPAFDEQMRGVLENDRVAENTFFCLERVFQEGGFAIHLEDDVVLCRDALRYFEWADERFRGDPDTLAVCSYRQTSVPEGTVPGNAYRVMRRPDEFLPTGWATWRDRWTQLLRPIWNSAYYFGWDMMMVFHYLPLMEKRLNAAFAVPAQFHRRYVIQPVVSRSNNVGARGQNCNFNSFPRYFCSEDLPAGITDDFFVAGEGPAPVPA